MPNETETSFWCLKKHYSNRCGDPKFPVAQPGAQTFLGVPKYTPIFYQIVIANWYKTDAVRLKEIWKYIRRQIS